MDCTIFIRNIDLDRSMGVHRGLILSVLFVLLLSACGKEDTFICNKPYIQVGNECCLDQNTNKICDIDEQPQEPKTTEEPQPEANVEIQGDQTVDDLLNQIHARVKSISYSTVTKTIGQARVFIKGEKIKIKPSKTASINGNEVNIIYLDDVTKIAIGICKSDVIVCRDKEEVILDYYQVREKDPVEWIEDFRGQTPEQIIESAEMVDGRSTDLYVFRQGRNMRTKLYLDNDFKIPVRVVELRGTAPINHFFTDLSINTVSQADVEQ